MNDYEPIPMFEEQPFQWIRCSERVPESAPIPSSFLEYQNMQLNKWPLYLTVDEEGRLELMEYFYGWNCRLNYDSGHTEWYVSRKTERRDIVAWANVPEYIYPKEKGAK